ncbi:MAG: preprotein translocase subunit SecY [Omnitrophica WOR_2 bacterium RIFCSPLOWO2_02_FULL_63_16]|nr:MAG: preprotein translocase subunit SecY [Omnitrophica WOR_2 bacterium GWA2_63_20]OGX16773.1 MAG: preprotein translocase subunit SecY [Omnitrophica WOR_2 bacterium GWF2_63_9]OGX36668.1 MAG: preprotein translocase subunit SecY [Omnitrophica WOR_2 bacterium RIFCSPHIGHO2_02_FULL_63_39]OGX45030.1 MAG: preprotein translocase subunit SecY [Omnitrophica WOR_2 bacterium RIFCSPLOWO2_02_FULL_63_16]OGX49998.1 MAG: preprotein translocase subunit SecY [Omnitrophica WOR_2 bacterium RIFCSPLOWO2_12_FULL_63_
MFRLLSALGNAWKIPELRRRILFTLGMLAIYEVGIFIPTPGINGKELGRIFDELAQATGGGLLNLLDMFTGGALSHATVFALGIMPYISATIIVETLLATAIPSLERLRKEGPAGYRKLHQYARYATVLLAVINSFMYAILLEKAIPAQFQAQIVLFPGMGFRLLTILTMTSGMAMIMWLAEQITERGIGNGMSLLMTASIVGRIPLAIRDIGMRLGPGAFGENPLAPLAVIFMLTVFVFVVFVVIFVEQGQRRVPVQYARRVVGGKVFSGQSTYLPLKVNTGGVLPIIFAVSLLYFPIQIAGFIPQLRGLADWFSRTSVAFNLIYAVLILFFTYFCTAITAHQFLDASEQMKKVGAFIPGIRPGQATVEYLDLILTRVTFLAAVYLVAIAIFPDVLMAWMKIPPRVASFFGGTSLLIVVGVTLDTMKQIESHLLMRHYEGFMKRGRLRSRR